MPTGKTVLLVEDNPSVLLLMERALASEDYLILTAPDGEAALQLATEDDRRIDLLVADLVLPHIGGLELAWRLSERDPQIRIILISGYAGEEAALSVLSAGQVAFLEKPFTGVALRELVRELFAGSDSGAADPSA